MMNLLRNLTVLFENASRHWFRLNHLAAGEARREVVPCAFRWVLTDGTPGGRWWPRRKNDGLRVESHLNLCHLFIDDIHVEQDRFHHILELIEDAELRFVNQGVFCFINDILSLLLLFLATVR